MKRNIALVILTLFLASFFTALSYADTCADKSDVQVGDAKAVNTSVVANATPKPTSKTSGPTTLEKDHPAQPANNSEQTIEVTH